MARRMTAQAKAAAVLAAALVEDAPMTKQVAAAVITVAQNWSHRVTGVLTPATLYRNRYNVVLTVDTRYTAEDGWQSGAVEKMEVSYPSSWDNIVTDWQATYEAEGRWF